MKKLVRAASYLVAISTACMATLAAPANAQTINLQWNPEPTSAVAGYVLLYGNTSGNYTATLDVGTNTLVGVVPPVLGTNYYFVVKSYGADGTQSDPSSEISVAVAPAPFLTDQTVITNNLNFLQFTDGNNFGYYDTTYFPWIYHLDLGFEYLIDANDGQNGSYIYDNTSETFWYTNPAVFPYVYDFTLNSWLYYYPDANNPGHYTTNPRRFYDFTEQQIITK